MFFGIMLLLLGILLVLERMGYLRGSIWSYLLPSSVIALGLSMILKRLFRAGRHPHIR